METQSSHPFFVYGKGWASFSPEEALHAHGLKCQLLEVGDVCISLTPRDQPEPTPSASKSASAEVIGSPQNLSRKQMPQTISTTATGTAVTSRPIPSYEPSHYSQQLHHHHQQQQQQLHQQQQHQQMMSQRHLSDTIYGMHASRLSSVSERKFSTPMAPPPPPPSSLSSSSSSSSSSSAEPSYDSGEAIDATMHSRKRRTWSICENICDDPKKSKHN